MKREIYHLPVTIESRIYEKKLNFFKTPYIIACVIVPPVSILTQPGADTDGVSLTPLLKGENKIDREAIFWHFPHYSNHGMQSPGGAVRCGDYKLLDYYENSTVQLFNLKDDIREQNDLSGAESEKVKDLQEMLHHWRKSVNAKMMEPNPDFKSININSN